MHASKHTCLHHAHSQFNIDKHKTTNNSDKCINVCVACVYVCGVHANCARVHVYVCACQCVCVECLCMLVCLCACACVSLCVCVCLFLLQVGSTPCGKCETLAITTKVDNS